MISLVIPTYNEAGAIQELIRRAAAALSRCDEEFEIVVVDDASQDGTGQIVESMGREYPVRLLRRPGRQGLASAVMQGWALARGEKLAVIDGDLQHPPEHLTALVRELEKQGADIAVASRRVAGGESELAPVRALISWTATAMAMFVLPQTLSRVRDPMSGYFLVRRRLIEGASLNPLGYKILLEVLARTGSSSVVEVPYVFNERVQGTSKMGGRQVLEYLLHLLRLSVATGELWPNVLRLLLIIAASFLIIYILYGAT